MCMIPLKICKNILKIWVNFFFEKKFFQTKTFERPLFLTTFGQKFDKSSEPTEFNRRRDACNSSKYPQYNLYDTDEKMFRNFSLKISENLFLVLKRQKIPKNRFFEKTILVGIDMEYSKTYSKTKISSLKIFSV